MLRGIMEALQTTDYKAFLTATDKSNFRYDIYPAYKEGRKAEKPTHYHRLRDYLLETHGAELVLDQEADDALGIAQTPETCIVTIDKDLDQIPGKHYNFVKKDFYEVTPDQGLRYFYEQLLMGDRIDNIPGIYGIGPVNAKRIIAPCKDERDMYEVVLREYERAPLSRSAKPTAGEVLWRGQLLKIRTREGELWEPPQ
jgi:5'-3' exonuclease